ncbi:glycosyltransferase family 2 protein [Nitrosomonas sp. Nm33]|uniref:glycosyltransferase family 2 protein n=1 Tax=Nitrosomonas sp. Nm33 TaxID=133724 RepID=UPI0008953C02|nr:glycosyltransferase family 2 protein [Nitrosomonas sp. Nm33]SDY94901.1 Glycosyl transferase family 2 [Nitrosomonas sp. Nm33]
MTTSTATRCAIMRNESRYIPEWIAYHRAIGFNDIFILDNESTDRTPDILSALAQQGLVRSMHWTTDGRHNQMLAYKAALSHINTEWVCFLDADEFLVLHDAATVEEFLGCFRPDVGLISINWEIFGSSKIERYDPAPTFERFVRAAPSDHKTNHHLKCFARVSMIDKPFVHSCAMRAGTSVDASGQDLVVEGNSFAPPNHKAAQINHYIIRSLEEYKDKCERGWANTAYSGEQRSPERIAGYLSFNDRNDEEDRSILKRLPEYRTQRAIIDQALRSVQN